MCMRVCRGVCLSAFVLSSECVSAFICMCVCVSLSSDSSSSGNPSRLPGQPAPTSWCMRSRWSGVAATTAQPYLITNKRVVPSVRYQAFSAKQTVIPASQTLALLPLLLRGESNIEIDAPTTPPASPLYPTHTNTHTHTCSSLCLNIFTLTKTYRSSGEMSAQERSSFFFSPSLESVKCDINVEDVRRKLQTWKVNPF